MDLFTKPDCQKCNWIKDNCDLSSVTIHELTDDNYDALGELAWFEGVTLAETSLPILVLDNGEKVSGALKIKNVLEGR